ncbi:MAG: proton-conducting transporter membrane subunit [Rikenellaceae bacterium]
MENIYLLVLMLLPMVARRDSKKAISVVALTLLCVLYGGMALCALVGVDVPVESLRSLSLTPLAAIFALMFSVALLPTILADRVNPLKTQFYYSVFYGSVIALFVSLYGVLLALSPSNSAEDTLWNFAINWEIMGLSSFVLMFKEGQRREYFHSAILYFIVMHVGFFFLLAGFISLRAEAGYVLGRSPMELHSWLLLFVGFALKSAIYPLYFWLPYTYKASLGGGAAVMAATSTNIGIFGIMTISQMVLDKEAVALILISLGLISALVGSFAMIKSSTFSRMLSFSSIENIGIIIFGFGFSLYAKIYGEETVALIAMIATVVKLFSHAITKALLLLVAGKVRHSSSTDTISKLGGVMKAMPKAGAMFAVGGMSLSSMPVLGSFVAEFMLLSALVMAFTGLHLSIVAVVGIVVVALASASTIFNVTKSFAVAFLGGARSQLVESIRETKNVMRGWGYALFIIFMTAGVWAFAYLMIEKAERIFGFESPKIENIWDMILGVAMVSGLFLVLVLLVVGWRKLLERNKTIRKDDTWGCGNPFSTQVDTQPSAESFSYEADTVVTLPIGKKTSRKIKRSIAPIRLLRRWTFRLALFQTGKISHYVLHIILFLVIVLILTLCGVL